MVKSAEKPVGGSKPPATTVPNSQPSVPQHIQKPAPQTSPKPVPPPVTAPVASKETDNPDMSPKPVKEKSLKPARGEASHVLSLSEYRSGATHRKEWEIDMIMSALKHYGVLDTKDASVLSTGAGTESTPFLIAPHVQWVFMTDLYLDMTSWSTWSKPGDILRTPEVIYPEATPLNVIPMHMDMRKLKFPDASFDAVFCTSSIEHLDTLNDVRTAAQEIGRVLRPGGVAIVVTEFKIEGVGNRFDNVFLFTEDDLRSEIVGPSGLTLVGGDTGAFFVDEETLATEWALADIIQQGKWPEIEGVLTQKGFKFTSVCLVMTKAEDAK